MISLILSLLLASQLSLSKGEDMLNQMASHYSLANGLQWTMQSTTYSQIFAETTISPVQFYFNPPDTFYYKSDIEEIIGIADTVWVLSKQHKQIQKKLSDSYLMPTDFIIKWNQRYDLKSYQAKGDQTQFELAGKKDVTPASVKLTLDKINHIKEIFYKDISGDDETLTFTKERLKRSSQINFFFHHIPQGYKLIDLIE